MKRIIRFVSIVLLCCSLCSPVVEARGPEHSQQSNNSRRNNNSSRGKKSPAQHTAPAGRPGNGGNNRPAQRPQERPSHNNAGQRPGQRPPQSNGNGRPQQRPPQHNGALDRPGGNVNMRPNRPNRPDRTATTTWAMLLNLIPAIRTPPATTLPDRRTTATGLITTTTGPHLLQDHICLQHGLITVLCHRPHGTLRHTGTPSALF